MTPLCYYTNGIKQRNLTCWYVNTVNWSLIKHNDYSSPVLWECHHQANMAARGSDEQNNPGSNQIDMSPDWLIFFFQEMYIHTHQEYIQTNKEFPNMYHLVAAKKTTASLSKLRLTSFSNGPQAHYYHYNTLRYYHRSFEYFVWIPSSVGSYQDFSLVPVTLEGSCWQLAEWISVIPFRPVILISMDYISPILSKYGI